MINISFLNDIALSSSLPESLVCDQVGADSADVEVIIGGDVVYSVTLFARNNTIYIYDFRNMVEEYMLSNSLSVTSLNIAVDNGHGVDRLDGDLYVVYSSSRIAGTQDLQFLDGNFLSSSSRLVIPRGACQFLYLAYYDATQDLTASADYIVRDDADGVVHTVHRSLSIARPPANSECLVLSHTIDTTSIVSDLNESTIVSPVLLGGKIVIGNRAMPFFVIDETPEEVFLFRNSFNALEYLFVYGRTTFKTSIDRDEGTCSGKTVFYNKRTERTHEVETRALTLEEATTFNEFLVSSQIFLVIGDDTDNEVVITDIDSEVSDSASEEVRIKFSWRFSDSIERVSGSDSVTSVFNKTFNAVYS